jgi:hypothetical protein
VVAPDEQDLLGDRILGERDPKVLSCPRHRCRQRPYLPGD